MTRLHEAAFRERLRSWLSLHAKEFSGSGDEYWSRQIEWHRALYEAGFFGLSWPRDYGGQELPPVYDVIVDEELVRAGAPPRPSVGYLVYGIGRHGSDELRKRFLPGIINGTERWCQGFSEPGAGSDLASLTTTATREGDNYVVHGHKIWTSYSDVADWCLLLARTDPEAKRHRGLSAFVIAMKQPGVQQRPLRMMNGVTNEFGQVFFDGATVPADRMVGVPGDGWAVAMTVVGHEREPSTLGYAARYGKLVRDLFGAQRRSGTRRARVGGGPVGNADSPCPAAAVRTAGRRVARSRRIARQAADDLGRAVRRARSTGGRRDPRPAPAQRLSVQPRAERHGRDITDTEEHHRFANLGIGSLTCTTCLLKSTSVPTGHCGSSP